MDMVEGHYTDLFLSSVCPLQRSDELLAVGQPAAALASVYEIIASGKRFRSTPLSSLEPIMFRYLDLCVELRKGKHAREGL